MSQKNETPALVLALLLTVGFLGAGFWWLMPKAGFKLATQTTTQETVSVNERMSQGERSLVQAESKADNPAFIRAKQAGIQAMAAKQYGEATAQFQ